ncbi:hypothetical protein TNCV_1757751 [Trichonephila clavipes]|nr:hypothetical protein TNCV_1757751 [Trichonephila clavipes]
MHLVMIFLMGLALEGRPIDSTLSGGLTLTKIATRVNLDISSSWTQTPVNEWYDGKHPGAHLLGNMP